MPSPVGHALAGLLVAALVAPRTARRPGAPPAPTEALPGPALYASLGLGVAGGLAPDLDFAPGLLIGDPGRFHHGPSHSAGAALAFGVAVWLPARLLASRGARLAPLGAARAGLLAGLAWAVHALLDALAVDASPPRGVMLWWPLSDRHVASAWPLFADIRRRQETTASFFATLATWHNLRAVLLEALLLGPAALVALRLRGRAVGRGGAGEARDRGVGS